MKYKKVREGLAERRKLWDAIKDPKAKAATRRPGSLNSQGSGPKSNAHRKRR